jgi:hypothetical protein
MAAVVVDMHPARGLNLMYDCSDSRDMRVIINWMLEWKWLGKNLLPRDFLMRLNVD